MGDDVVDLARDALPFVGSRPGGELCLRGAQLVDEPLLFGQAAPAAQAKMIPSTQTKTSLNWSATSSVTSRATDAAVMTTLAHTGASTLAVAAR